MKKALLLIALMGLIIAPIGCVTGQRGFPPKDQITNFDKVDDHLYRGAQPNTFGIEALAKAGVKTVINLRNDPWVEEAPVCAANSIVYVPCPLSGVVPPSKAAIEDILQKIAASPGPVFVHCQYGCDRTGTVIACYRIRKGETNAAALNDAKAHGISKLLPFFHRFILDFK